MAQVLILRHERMDDVPLILGLAPQLRLAEGLDRHTGTHGLQQGLHNGQLAVGWLADILSRADHRTSAVRDWAHRMSHTLAQMLGQPIRNGACSDDRLGGVWHRLGDDETWAAIARELWTATGTVDECALTGIRLDSTTSSGSPQLTERGVRQRGPSKDHRPDLPQWKQMAAAAEPSGHLLACDVQPGQAADDPLYTPLRQRVRGSVGRTGWVSAGDCKLAALATRAEIPVHDACSLVPLPLTGATAAQVEPWVTAIVDSPQEAPLLWEGERLLGRGLGVRAFPDRRGERPTRVVDRTRTGGALVCRGAAPRGDAGEAPGGCRGGVAGVAPCARAGQAPHPRRSGLADRRGRRAGAVGRGRLAAREVGAARDDGDPRQRPRMGRPASPDPYRGAGALCHHRRRAQRAGSCCPAASAGLAAPGHQCSSGPTVADGGRGALPGGLGAGTGLPSCQRPPLGAQSLERPTRLRV
jgi:hypothetical protein